jgi:ABC-type nitrate/sulfonate/bicarbonate transport system substrate-binding protein
MRKIAAPLTLCLGIFLSLFHSAQAQNIKIASGYASLSSAQLPLWMAKEKALFARNGLDVQAVFLTGMTPIMALIAGDTPITQIAGIGIVNSAIGGSDAVMIAGGTVTLDWWLMSRPEIKPPPSQGGSVAVSTFGTASDFIARFALQKIGLTRQGRRDGSARRSTHAPGFAGEQSSPGHGPCGAEHLRGAEKGFNVLADVAALGLPYQHTGVASTRKYIKEHPDIVRAFVRSYVEAVHQLKSDRKGGIACWLNTWAGSRIGKS